MEGGVLGKFYHKRHGKTRMDQNQIKAKTKKVFFLEETKSKKRFLRGQTQKRGFRKGLNDLLQTKQGSS